LNSFRFNESMNTVNMFGVSTAPHCNVWVRDLMAKKFLIRKISYFSKCLYSFDIVNWRSKSKLFNNEY
jgi:hypothetical protein